MSLANADGDVARRLWTFTARELRRMQERVLLLTKSAQERVASFLLDLAKRAAAEEIEVPMSRQDIADYLGLTIETISRTLTQLEAQAAIALPTSRRIVLCNRCALTRLNA
jgi:CRP/FNR family nitrogen fixation transcriptional regulator